MSNPSYGGAARNVVVTTDATGVRIREALEALGLTIYDPSEAPPQSREKLRWTQSYEARVRADNEFQYTFLDPGTDELLADGSIIWHSWPADTDLLLPVWQAHEVVYFKDGSAGAASLSVTLYGTR